MDDIFVRVCHDLVERTTGPMWFRLILQPLVAAVYGVRAGLANARIAKEQGNGQQSPGRGKRQALFRQGLKAVGKVFAIGVGLDAVFQLIALRTLYPLEAVLVGFLFVVVPYQVICSVVAWFASRS